jgi:putative endonuclease
MGIFKLNKKNLGYRGERVAEKFLKKKNYKIITKNWCNASGRRLGEIDIIIQNKKTKELIFVEVKSRQIKDELIDKVLPEEQIDFQKINKLQKIAENYIATYDLWNNNWRFDAVLVLFSKKHKVLKINHLKNIFF